MNDKVYSISIVVPVYNAEATLIELVDRILSICRPLYSDIEVILVNDGSFDHSWDTILLLTRKYPEVRGINFMKNYGQHNATLCGMRIARNEITITMDDDLQHRPEDVKIMTDKISEGFDVVYGASRRLPQGIMRNLFTKFTKWMLGLVMGKYSVKHISAFRAFKTSLLKASINFDNPNVIVDVLLSWGTSSFGYVYVDIVSIPEKRSNYNFVKLDKAALLVFTGYSTAPLRIASIIGFVIAFLGFLAMINVVVTYFTQGSVEGFPFLVSIITIFSGTQLFVMGVFGEYLSRIFDKSMNRPPYVIKSMVVSGQEKI